MSSHDPYTLRVHPALDPSRVLARHSSDIVYVVNADGLVTWISPAIARILGWSPDDIVGGSLSRLLHPDDLIDADADLARLAAASDPDTVLVTRPRRFRRPNGTFTWCSSTAVRAYDDDGVAIGLTGSIRDVDQLVHERDEASEVTERLREALDAHMDPWVTLLAIRDTAGEVIDFIFEEANAAAESFHESWPSPLEGSTVLHVLGAINGAADVAAAAQVLSTGEPLVINDSWSDVAAADGRPPMWLDIRITPIDEDRLLYTWRDATDRYVARAAHTDAHDTMRAILEAQVDPHALLRAVRDDQGTVVDLEYVEANTAAVRFEGFPREQLIGMTVRQLYRDTAEAEFDLEICCRAWAAGEPVVLTDVPSSEYTSDDGAPTYYDISVAPVDADRVAYTWRDVTERHEAAARLAESEARFRLLAENMAEIVVLAQDGSAIWISPSVSRALGYTPQELVGVSYDTVVEPEDLERLLELWLPVREGTLPRLRFRARTKSGEQRWLEADGTTYHQDGRTITVVSARVVDAEVAALHQLERLAQLDDLTGLLNRGSIIEALEQQLSRTQRRGGGMALIFCDLDGFKGVNDQLGHAAGDLVLQRVARRLVRGVRAVDTVARLGGDELLVVLNGVADLDDAVRVAEKLRAEIARPYQVPDGVAHIGASLGVTLVMPGDSVDDLIARADRAMYEAKRSGKGTVVAIPGE